MERHTIPKQLLTRLEAAAWLGLSPSMVSKLLADGVLPSIKIGTARRFDVADLEAFVASRKVVRNG